MMPTLPTDATPASCPPPGTADAEIALAVLGDLEASLGASQKALLARDVDAIERGTLHQMHLSQALAILCAPHTPALRVESGLLAELQAAEARVLHLGRVQAALLSRAQQSLAVLSNLLAGPGATYGPPKSPPGAWPATTGRKGS